MRLRWLGSGTRAVYWYLGQAFPRHSSQSVAEWCDFIPSGTTRARPSWADPRRSTVLADCGIGAASFGTEALNAPTSVHRVLASLPPLLFLWECVTAKELLAWNSWPPSNSRNRHAEPLNRSQYSCNMAKLASTKLRILSAGIRQASRLWKSTRSHKFQLRFHFVLSLSRKINK